MNSKKMYWVVQGLFFVVATIHVILSRGLFFDEAIYFIAGKTLVFQGSNWNYQTWFVGSPWMYPKLIGYVLKWTSTLGWSQLAWVNYSIPIVRELNVIFMLITIILVFRTSFLLNGRKHSAWSGFFFAFSGCVLFVSGFATYDTLSLLFTAISLWLVIEATEDSTSKPVRVMLILTSGAFLGLSFITKYITMVFLPALLAVIFARVVSSEARTDLWAEWPKLCLWFTVAFLAVALCYVIPNYSALSLVFGYSGGHTATYGATPVAILFETVIYGGLVWLMSVLGVSTHKDSTWFVGLVLLGASLIVPVYHLVFTDPLALFKQMTWVLMFASIFAGILFSRMGELRVSIQILVMVIFASWGWYQMYTLERFYPDPSPAATWLQQNVRPEDCNVLVDDVWAYRWALNTTFDKQEWCVTDQWWWYGSLANPDMWVGKIYNAEFSYIVVERGPASAFSGDFTVFNNDVIDAIEESGRYHKVAQFDSQVTWGNAIILGGFHGILKPYSIVSTEIWQRGP